MRILYLSTSSGSRGGGEIYLKILADNMHKKGHEVAVVYSSNKDMDEIASTIGKGINIIRVNYKNTYKKIDRGLLDSVCSVNDEIKSIINNFSPDIIHLNKQNIEDGLDLLKIIKNIACPAVTTIHVTNSMSSMNAKLGWLRDYLARKILKKSDITTIVVSEKSRRSLKSILGNGKASNIRVVDNGIEKFDTLSRNESRKMWGVGGDKYVIGTLARINKQKNPLFICDVLHKLHESVVMVWIGDGDLKSELQNKVDNYGMTDRFIITGWSDDARKALSGLDAFVLPSLYEGMPLALLEAMSLGLPCIVSDIDGMDDVIKDKKNGIKCGSYNVDCWEDAINRLRRDADFQNEISSNAKESYIKRYTIDNMVDSTLKVYDEAINNH